MGLATALLPILASTAMSPATINPDPIMSYILERNRSISSEAAILELIIDDKREIRSCRPAQSGFDAEEDERICAALLGKKVSAAATGPDGAKVHSWTTFSFTLGEELLVQPPDVIVGPVSLPEGVSSGARASVDIFVAADGAVEQCAAGSRTDPRLGEIACSRAVGLRLDPVTERDGTPVPYVTSLIFAFTTDEAE